VTFVDACVAAQLVVAGTVEALREVFDRSEPEWHSANATTKSRHTLLESASAKPTLSF